MKIIDFYNKLDELYPRSLSAEWDNDGLMCCKDEYQNINGILICLDPTIDSIRYAIDNNINLILTHHPLIFKPLNRINNNNIVSKRLLFALDNDISIISLHTRLDCGINGVNDTLAQLIGLNDITSFGDLEMPSIGRMGYTDINNPDEFINHINSCLGCKATSYISKSINKVAIVGGSGLSYANIALENGCDTLLTGEGGYNACIDNFENGINIICAGHYFTEIPVCKSLFFLCEKLIDTKINIYNKQLFTL